MEESPRKKRSFWKWFFRILLILFVLFIALFLWKGDYLLEKAVTDKLYESYFEVPTGNYDYELEQLDINVYSRSISMRNLRIFPKKEFLDEVAYRGLETTYLSAFSVESLEVTGLRLLRFVRKGELLIGGFDIGNPVMQLNLVTDTAMAGEKTDTAGQGGMTGFSLARIDRLQVTGGDISVYDLSDNMQLLYGTDSTHIILRNLKIDSSGLAGGSPVDFRSIDIRSRFLEASLPGDQHVSINRFRFSSEEDYLYCDTFLVGTAGFKPETGRMPGSESAFQVRGRELNILGFDPRSIYRDKSVAAEEIRLDGLSAVYYMQNESSGDIYEDSVTIEEPDTASPQSGLPSPMPSAMIRELPVPLSLRDIIVNDASIEFMQYDKAGRRPGEMFMTEVNVRISGLSNDRRSIRRNQTTVLDLDGRLYDTGDVRVTVDLPLGDQTDRMDVYFKLGSMPFTDLNRIAESTGILKISSGLIDSLECSLTLNSDSAWGDMSFVYHDLHVRLMKEIDRRRKLVKKRRILSLAANGLIRNNNDPARPSFRQGEINYRRGPGESFSSFITFSLVQGLAASLAPAIEDKVTGQPPQE